MPNPIEHIRQQLLERVRELIEDHRATDHTSNAGSFCSCGAQGLSDHRFMSPSTSVTGWISSLRLWTT